MIDRAVLVPCEEYAIAVRHVTDRLRRSGQEGPSFELGSKELSVLLQYLDCIVLRIEGDRHEGDLGAEIRPQFILYLCHLLGQQRADVRASGVDEGHGHDLAVQPRKGHWHAVLRGQGKLRRWPDDRQPFIVIGLVGRRRRRQQERRQCEQQDNEAQPPMRPVLQVFSPSARV